MSLSGAGEDKEDRQFEQRLLSIWTGRTTCWS